MSKAEKYQQKLEAVQTIMGFMADLVPRYRATTMTFLWQQLSIMTQRYGFIFVADCINRSKAEAELALFRYGTKGAQI